MRSARGVIPVVKTSCSPAWFRLLFLRTQDTPPHTTVKRCRRGRGTPLACRSLSHFLHLCPVWVSLPGAPQTRTTLAIRRDGSMMPVRCLLVGSLKPPACNNGAGGVTKPKLGRSQPTRQHGAHLRPGQREPNVLTFSRPWRLVAWRGAREESRKAGCLPRSQNP